MVTKQQIVGFPFCYLASQLPSCVPWDYKKRHFRKMKGDERAGFDFSSFRSSGRQEIPLSGLVEVLIPGKGASDSNWRSFGQYSKKNNHSIQRHPDLSWQMEGRDLPQRVDFK
jgi:hypothetical protein